MKRTAFAIALLMSGTAVAQTTTTTTDVDVNADGTVTTTTTQDMNMTTTGMPAGGQVVQPSNANPEEDARGITVISDAAVVPAGWNGTTGTAVGGPMVDPATGQTMTGAETNPPACSKTITDNCVQTYERGRRS